MSACVVRLSAAAGLVWCWGKGLDSKVVQGKRTTSTAIRIEFY